MTLMAGGTGLRERKKRATHEALRAAALRLATERGPANVRVDDIAAAAGVSVRTYNNYFASREHAIVAAVTAERDERVAAAVAEAPAGVRLADAVVDAIVEQYCHADDGAQNALSMISASVALRAAYLDETSAVEGPLSAMFLQRFAGEEYAARVLAAAVAAAVRVAVDNWLHTPSDSTRGGLVVVSGDLPDALRAALAPLAPAIDEAEGRAARH